MEFVEKRWWVIAGVIVVFFGGYLLLGQGGSSDSPKVIGESENVGSPAVTGESDRVSLPEDSSSTNKMDEFAECLTDQGAVFYGAYWCSHCQNQKKAFGDAFEYVNYVECATPDGRGQTKECQDKQIRGYPTWEFADGSRVSGEVPMETLGEKTGCQL